MIDFSQRITKGELFDLATGKIKPSLIDAAGLTPVLCTNAEDTPLGVQWNDGDTVITGTLIPSASTQGKLYFVPAESTAEKNIYDEYFTLLRGTDYVWECIGRGIPVSTHPYLSLERLRKYLYKVTFDTLPEDNGGDGPILGGCSSYVKDGKLYRNLDFKYDNSASFIVRTKDFEGMSFITGLNDGAMDDAQIAQLPYRIVDGRNNNGIMVSTHVVFNDWSWAGVGSKTIPLTRLPYLVLSNVKSMATIAADLSGIIDRLYAPESLLASGYLIQVLVTDGTTTYAILPPANDDESFVLQNITGNPKLTNFRWVNRATVARADADLQTRPTGIERFNMMPCELADLRFTKAYETADRLSEFIGIDETTKASTDAELESIYDEARALYLDRARDGQTWQTMHSVVYGEGLESLFIQENWDDACVVDVSKKYEKPLAGIPLSDISASAQEALIDIVSGFLDSGVFYKDSAHTQAITPVKTKQYVDVTNAAQPKLYMWNGSAYVEVGGGGGSDVYETVNVILVSSDASDIELGKIVTLKYADVTETLAYVAGGIVFRVPTSMEYTINVEPEVGYITPPELRRIAIAGNAITITKTYVLNESNLIVLNQNVTDAASMLSGEVNGDVIRWIRANSHRYLAKRTAYGEVTLCQLMDSDSTKYLDGTTADLTGAEGDVVMKLPTFWFKCEETETGSDIWNLIISRTEVEGYQKWEGNKNVLGVYEAINVSNKLYSRSGVTPSGSISQANFKKYARARGTGYSIVTWEWHKIMALLFYCKYGYMNCQALIGSGTNSYTKVAGQTDNLGMTDTQASVQGNEQSINFWGLENWWGDKIEWMDNIVLNPTEANGTWQVTDLDGNTRDILGCAYTQFDKDTWPKRMLLGEHFDLIAKEIGASDATGYCDDYYISNQVGRVVYRSSYYAYSSGGVACAKAHYDSSYSNTGIGSRLAFHGNTVVETDVATFKAIIEVS